MPNNINYFLDVANNVLFHPFVGHMSYFNYMCELKKTICMHSVFEVNFISKECKKWRSRRRWWIELGYM